ncbi:MAG: bifunctional hydroxymethylpyrimidine kinase/phosphomethylpyrimidine kinase [Acholeplasmataceae bacterium]|nr:bifunctional hydroxymethylpyrimidine kinase/phosphomethylpyrimidine kinase [Acidaminococcaceae bacterium]NLY83846.1 bifunctional hydroxymethylpyrimidine kinase/phosphomethylpyrimidine kinase [Acholeplasmataceae bacterium]
MKHLLTIAGSDSSGGAGIQADLKTFSALGTYGMSVITAVTAQNTCGVTMVQNIDEEVVEAQINAVFDDIRVDAVKIGMVSDKRIIRKIAQRLRFYKPPIIVLDPVMVSKSGYHLLAEDACSTLIKELLPLATLVTPNLPEAEVIAGFPVRTRPEMLAAAKRITELGAKSVLVKGGHLTDSADDLLFYEGGEHWLKGEHIATNNTHGTGCTLSSALAAHLSVGLPLAEAVKKSKDYVTLAIRYSLEIGAGCGPTHHFVNLYRKAGWL